MYSVNDVKTIFNIAPETVRNWAKEYAKYLSFSANPQPGRQRVFTEDDMKVLDLVNRMRREGKNYEEIHMALAAGQRGYGPGFSPQEVRSLISGELEQQLSMEIQLLRRQVAVADERVKELEELKTVNVRLEAEREAEKRRADEYADRLKETQEKLETLYREVGRAFHEGYLAALERKNGNQS